MRTDDPMDGLEQELLKLRDRVADSVAPRPELATQVLRRARAKRVITAMTGIGMAVVVGASSLAAARYFEAKPPSPAGRSQVQDNRASRSLDFESGPGWYVRTTDPNTVPDLSSQAWASNFPFPDSEEPVAPYNVLIDGAPDKTEAALPADGILIVANYALQTRNPLPPMTGVPERSLPLQIDQQPSVTGEGQDPQHAQSVVSAIVNGRYLNVRIVFGTNSPSSDLIRQANTELGRLLVAASPATILAIDDFGIRMDLPASWKGILFRWAFGEPTVYAGTVPILDLNTSSLRNELGPDDVFVVLSENYASAIHYERVDLPVNIRPEDACPTCEILDGGNSPPKEHSLFYRSFSVNDRQFDLWAEFGTATPTSDQLARLNDALATLEIVPPAQPTASPSPEPAPQGSVSVDLPSGWIGKDDPVPASSAPHVVSAYGTWNLPAGGRCGPEVALKDLPSDGGLVWVVEHANPPDAGDFIPLTPLFSIDLQTPPARWECAAAAPSRMYLFQVEGRYFEVHVAFGPDASEATIRQAEALIKSLKAAP